MPSPCLCVLGRFSHTIRCNEAAETNTKTHSANDPRWTQTPTMMVIHQVRATKEVVNERLFSGCRDIFRQTLFRRHSTPEQIQAIQLLHAATNSILNKTHANITRVAREQQPHTTEQRTPAVANKPCFVNVVMRDSNGPSKSETFTELKEVNNASKCSSDMDLAAVVKMSNTARLLESPDSAATETRHKLE